MLRDIDKTLEKLLYERGNIPRQDVEVSFDQPTGDWSSRLNRPTINCWCFDIRENLPLRTGGMNVQFNRDKNTASKSFPDRRMDVTYLISTWATEVEDEHRLLWRVLSTLKRMPFWKPEDCADELRYQTRNMPLLVADMTDAPFNLTELWGVLENQMKLGFIFRVTVELELDAQPDVPLVLTSTIRYGQSENPPEEVITTEAGEILIPRPRVHWDGTPMADEDDTE